jgi:hypothetical protein
VAILFYAGETTGLEQIVDRAADASHEWTVPLVSVLADFAQLPMWLQLLAIAVIAVSVAQWQRRRNRSRRH